MGVLDEPYSAEPAQRSSHAYRPAGLPKGWTVDSGHGSSSAKVDGRDVLNRQAFGRKVLSMYSTYQSRTMSVQCS